MRQPSSDREQGFTLIELLMAITLSGLLISALTAGFITTMRGTAGAHERFVASNGAHTLATYFTSDVQSADPSLVTTDPVDTGCSDPAAGTDNVLRLQWSEMATTTTMKAFSVSYRTRQVDGIWQLARYACSGQAPLPTTPSAILSGAAPTAKVMAHDIYDPTEGPDYVTQASVAGRKVTLNAFAALATGQTEPYSYVVSANMRTPGLFPVVLGIDRLDPDPTNASTLRWTVLFSDDVTGVDAGDFVLVTSGLTGAGLTGEPTEVDPRTYTVSAATGTGDDGTIGLDLDDDDSIVDGDGEPLGGAGPVNGDFTGQVYTVDRIGPSVIVEQHATQADPATSLPILFTATFSERINGFDAGDVTKGGDAPGGTGPGDVTVTAVSPTVYDVAVGGLTGDGTVIVSIVANQVLDQAGNQNTASNSAEVMFQASPVAAPSIESVQLVNRLGGIPGTIEEGDRMVVTFSEEMKPSSFCSTWSDDSSNQGPTAGEAVMVNVTNSGEADSLSVTTTCPTSNFGSIALKGNFVSGDVTFGGNGSGVNTSTTATWNAGSRTLEITFGKASQSTWLLPVTSPTSPDYTTSATDPNGVGVDNSPFTLPEGIQF